jgi:hypothetical protein
MFHEIASIYHSNFRETFSVFGSANAIRFGLRRPEVLLAEGHFTIRYSTRHSQGINPSKVGSSLMESLIESWQGGCRWRFVGL